MMSKNGYIIANFGGPRNLKEIEPFLRALLTDKDVIQTKLPQFVQNIIFGNVAQKRAQIIAQDYAKIGGGSPIWSDTEYVAHHLRPKIEGPILTFHRYLPATHSTFVEQINQMDCNKILVFPMFPQFTYATTGSIARFFLKKLSSSTLKKLRWVKSYPTHPAFIQSFENAMRDFLLQVGLKENELFLIFSAHGLPQSFIDHGDLYSYECQLTFEQLMSRFPKAEGKLCYQSKFGRGEWIKPYTIDLCQQIKSYTERKYCLFVPLSFTSDHIETLFEIEEQYMPIISAQGLHPFRLPALGRRTDWIDAIPQILSDSPPCSTPMLLR